MYSTYLTLMYAFGIWGSACPFSPNSLQQPTSAPHPLRINTIIAMHLYALLIIMNYRNILYICIYVLIIMIM